jgi:Family of unknown function (DUF6166)
MNKDSKIRGHRWHETDPLAEFGVEVWIDDKQIDPTFSQTICNHSPDGFEFGYNGSGPSQLSLAILLEMTNDIEWSKQYYMIFRREKIATLKCNHFFLQVIDVVNWIKERGGTVDGF